MSFGICEACIKGNNLYSMNDKSLFSNVVGFRVDSFENENNAFVKKKLEAGKYAVFTLTGCITYLSQTYNYIWVTWFHSTNEKLDNREDFEVYDHRFLGRDNPNYQFDIYIPIK